MLGHNRNLAYNPATGLNYPFTMSANAHTRMGNGDAAILHRRVQLPRAADGIHEADEQPVAGVRDISLSGQWNLQNTTCCPGCQYVTTLTLRASRYAMCQ